MHFTRTAAVSVLAGLCLAQLAATPALAATPTGAAVPSHEAASSASAQEITVDSVRVVHVSGETEAWIRLVGTPNRSFAYVYDEETGYYAESPLAGPDKIQIRVEIKAGQVNDFDVHVVSQSDGTTLGSVPVHIDDTAFAFAAPKVSVVAHHDTGKADVTVLGKPGAFATPRDSAGRPLATHSLPGGTYTFELDLPEAESHYTMDLAESGYEADATPFTLPGRAWTLPAPTAEVAGTVGTRAVLDVASEPGSVLRVTDASGKLVAVRVTGTSGTAQALVPLPTKAGPVDVTAGRGDMTSAATPVDLPARS